jgi:hypothetical protein
VDLVERQAFNDETSRRAVPGGAAAAIINTG